MPESYTRTNLGVRGRFREAVALYRFHRVNPEEQVSDFLSVMHSYRSHIESLLQQKLEERSILEIGPGQLMKNARFFAAHNRVVAVDLDQVITAWSFNTWWTMLRRNGPLRFAKTVARRTLGVDRRFIDELTRQMPATGNGSVQILQRDAAHTELEAESFDCVVSFSVLEHLPEPALVLREADRLLRPGGVAFHVIHCFTSDSGAHDARSFAIERSDLPYWCHLRADKAHLVASNSYVNRLSIREWKTLVDEELPGATTESVVQYEFQRLVKELQDLRAAGELEDYSDDELMTVCLHTSWVKPGRRSKLTVPPPGSA
jgi:SAM-dependent methyltransferase